MKALAMELMPYVALGALGSLHCAGMCGAFAVAVTTSGERAAGAALRRQSGYVLGKASTYATLGLALATGVSSVPDARLGDAVAWIAGAVLIAFGLSWLGWLPLRGALSPRLPLANRAVVAVRRIHAELLRLPGFAGAFGAGAANGLVPCGLSWAAIAMAATASPTAAVLGPFVFGLMTAPALVLVGLGGWLVRNTRVARMAPALIGIALIAGGAMTGIRGVPSLSRADGNPDCCDSHAPASAAAGGLPGQETP